MSNKQTGQSKRKSHKRMIFLDKIQTILK